MDDTNFLYSSISLKDINQKINFELKNIVHWIRANKICLDTKEIENSSFWSTENNNKEKHEFSNQWTKDKYYERKKIFRDGNGLKHLTLNKSYGHYEAKNKQSKWFISQVKALC